TSQISPISRAARLLLGFVETGLVASVLLRSLVLSREPAPLPAPLPAPFHGHRATVKTRWLSDAPSLLHVRARLPHLGRNRDEPNPVLPRATAASERIVSYIGLATPCSFVGRNVIVSHPELWQILVSMYPEKARWALDCKRVPHIRYSLLPGPHAAM